MHPVWCIALWFTRGADSLEGFCWSLLNQNLGQSMTISRIIVDNWKSVTSVQVHHVTKMKELYSKSVTSIQVTIGAINLLMYNIAFHYSMVTWRRIIYVHQLTLDLVKWLWGIIQKCHFISMVMRASSKMLVYFNGCVCYKKYTRYHIFGIILRVGMRKGSMTELVH